MSSYYFFIVILSLGLSACDLSLNSKSKRLHEDEKITFDHIRKQYDRDENKPEYSFDSTKACFFQGITGGNQVEAGNPRRKHLVLLVMESENGSAACTGTLISKKTILTAAHCFDGNPSSVTVIFHENPQCSQKGTSLKNVRYSQKVLTHPQWNPNWQAEAQGSNVFDRSNFDLALVQLSENAPPSHQPIPLAVPQDLSLSSEVIQIGYGKTSTKDKSLPKLRELFKKSSDLNIYSHSRFLVFPSVRNISGPCMGDSGGPLLIKHENRYKVLAVASFLHKNESLSCEESDFAYYSIHEDLQWIRQNLL